MRCPNCDGRRIVRAAAPGEVPDRTCVCLGCGHLWQDDRHAAVRPAGRDA